MKHLTPLCLICLATTAFAEENRQLDAHEHGVGELNIGIDGTTVGMEFHAPGADIVGFEYAAQSDADKAAIDTALATLLQPQNLFVVPADAGCTVTMAKADLEGEAEHDNHDDEKHDEHADKDGHDDHDHDDHAEHNDKDAAGHTEFHAEYTMTCANPAALTGMIFAYFDAFPNALEVEVQIVSSAGAAAFDVERDAPVLDLKGAF